jgi:hypothetical protein
MKLTKIKLKEIIREVILTESPKRTAQWYLSKLNKVKFPGFMMRTTKRGGYRWGYIKDEPGYDYLSNKIYFYKNKPVVGTYTTIMDITYITYLTDDLPDGVRLPTTSYSEWEGPIFDILIGYKIGQ